MKLLLSFSMTSMAFAPPPSRSRPPPPHPPSAPRNQVTPRLSLVLYRRKFQPMLSNTLHPPEPPDPPDPTITPQPLLPSSLNSSPPQSPSPFCAAPSSISGQSPSSLPSALWFRLSLHNKVLKIICGRRSLTDSWETEVASLSDSPKRTDLPLSSSKRTMNFLPTGKICSNLSRCESSSLMDVFRGQFVRSTSLVCSELYSSSYAANLSLSEDPKSQRLLLSLPFTFVKPGVCSTFHSMTNSGYNRLNSGSIKVRWLRYGNIGARSFSLAIVSAVLPNHVKLICCYAGVEVVRSSPPDFSSSYSPPPSFERDTMPDSFISEVTRLEHFNFSAHDVQSLKAMKAHVPISHKLLPSRMPYFALCFNEYLTKSPQDKGSISSNSSWRLLTTFMCLKPAISTGRQCTASFPNLRLPKLQLNSPLNLSFLDKFFQTSSRQGRERSSSISSFQERIFSPQSLFVRGDPYLVSKMWIINDAGTSTSHSTIALLVASPLIAETLAMQNAMISAHSCELNSLSLEALVKKLPVFVYDSNRLIYPFNALVFFNVTTESCSLL